MATCVSVCYLYVLELERTYLREIYKVLQNVEYLLFNVSIDLH